MVFRKSVGYAEVESAKTSNHEILQEKSIPASSYAVAILGTGWLVGTS